MNLVSKGYSQQKLHTSLRESNLTSTLHTFIITGNSRFRILNDYEDGLINKNYIVYKNKGFPNKSYGVLSIKAYKSDKEIIKSKKYNFDYITFKYIQGIPYVNIVWPYEKFTPYYVIYPIRNIKSETLHLFNIKDPMIIDNYELSKNNKILDDEYFKFHRNNNVSKNKIICKPHSIISKYGTIIKLTPRSVKNKIISDSVLSSDDSDDKTESDSES